MRFTQEKGYRVEERAGQAGIVRKGKAAAEPGSATPSVDGSN